MDVVVQNIQSIGGTLDIESAPGMGSTMSLKIPLTLAIIDGIVMETGTSSFVLETGVIKEFFRIKEDMMFQEPNGDEYIMIRGECYPVLRLGKWYGLEEYQESVENGIMLILEVEDKKVCVFVDRLIGEQESRNQCSGVIISENGMELLSPSAPGGGRSRSGRRP